jgi:hypothetical protein
MIARLVADQGQSWLDRLKIQQPVASEPVTGGY